MLFRSLYDLLHEIAKIKSETQNIEIKAAKDGCPSKIYDTLSSFSNQDDGGIILFGIDESQGFSEVGVYDAQDLQKHITEQCNQMSPAIRPVFSTVEKDGKIFVCAEIPGLDISDRPCFYAGKGRMKGSYVRVGDADEPMTEYEIYSYEAFRKKYQDDIRVKGNVGIEILNKALMDEYLMRIKANKPNLAQSSDARILELMSMTKNAVPTLAAILLFGDYPQAVFPQLCITAISVPGREVGEIGSRGERFIDNKRIEGTLPQMLEEALMFVRKNTKTTTIIDPKTGIRTDRDEYPLVAVREAVLNALIHRDYSMNTEGMPVQIILYEDRLEISNPGGLYGRMKIDQLGKVQPDTRNPVLAVAMEILNKTENRYSGIPTIRRELKKASMPEPEFRDLRGKFSVCFYKEKETVAVDCSEEYSILSFCKTYRTRKEIADFLKIKTQAHAIKTYVMPLVKRGVIELEHPEKPRSPSQRYRTKI